MKAWLVGLVDRHISAVACSILLGTPTHDPDVDGWGEDATPAVGCWHEPDSVL